MTYFFQQFSMMELVKQGTGWADFMPGVGVHRERRLRRKY